jgi:membrane protease YdiL (CAAX protease family)
MSAMQPGTHLCKKPHIDSRLLHRTSCGAGIVAAHCGSMSQKSPSPPVGSIAIVLLLVVVDLARTILVIPALSQFLASPLAISSSSYVISATALILAYIYIKKANKDHEIYSSFSTEVVDIRTIVLIGIAGGFAWVLVSIGGLAVKILYALNFSPELAERFLHDPVKDATALSETHAFRSNSISAIALAVGVRGVLIPIYEELFVRSLLLNTLCTRFSLTSCILISATIFALLHAPNRVISSFFFGIFTALLFLKYRTIVVPIVLHVTTNVCLSMLEALGVIDSLHSKTLLDAQAPVTWTIALLIGLAGLAAAGLILFRHRGEALSNAFRAESQHGKRQAVEDR